MNTKLYYFKTFLWKIKKVKGLVCMHNILMIESDWDNHGVEDTAGVGSGESDVTGLSPSGGP